MTDQSEPTLEDILNEPIIQQVMRSDRVNADEIRILMRTAAVRRDRGTDGLVVTRSTQAPVFHCTATAA